MCLLFVGLVSAVVTEDNYVNYGEIDSSGNLITTSTAVNGASVLGYVCSSANCASVSSVLFGPLNVPANFITLSYPTTLLSSFGYGIYVYKTGYIPYEAESDYAGTGQASNYTNYLSRLQSCKSNIDSLTLTQNGGNIDVEANVDSPINHGGPLNYMPAPISSHYAVDVDVKMEVKKDGVLDNTKTQTKTVNIPFSDDEDVDFSFVAGVGVYEVKIITSKGDDKCVGEVLVEKTKSITIAPSPDPCLSNPNLGQSCSIGVGACNNVGVYVCNSAGTDVECNAVAGTPATNDANCNGIDDDCNFLIDDGYVSTSTSCGLGLCASTGFLQCILGSETNSCVVGTSSFEICDGLDNDCDGVTDEGCSCTNGNTQSCGIDVGECSFGTQTCSSGIWGSCVGGVGPAIELCDGFDNDCDGAVDEGYVEIATSCGVGVCATGGLLQCVGGVEVDSCSAGLSGVEICDGLDNDCDGTVDEGCGGDVFGPIVNLLAPPGGQTFYGFSYIVDFVFSVSDQSEVSSCYANVSGVSYPNVSSIDKVLDNTIGANLSEGNYSVQVFCSDVFGNDGNSGEVLFSVKQLGVCSVDANCSDDYYGNRYCKGDDIYENFHDFSCVNGTCVENVTEEFVKTCVDDCTKGRCTSDDTDYNRSYLNQNTGTKSLINSSSLNLISLGNDEVEGSWNLFWLWIILLIIGILIVLIYIVRLI